MERIIKKLLYVLIILFFLVNSSFADTPNQVQSQMVPQNVTLAQCIRTFNVGYEKLFYLTEIAICSNNYSVDEIQSQGGYILFSVAQYRFIATVFTFGENKAILKITPCNNNYNFPPVVIQKIFGYINTNQYKKY